MQSIRNWGCAVAGALMTLMSPEAAAGWGPFDAETGFTASAAATQVYGEVPGTKLGLLPAKDINRQTVVQTSGQKPVQPGPASASVAAAYGIGGSFAGTVVNSQGIAEPVVKAAASARYLGQPLSDGFARAQAGGTLLDVITVQSSTLPVGAPVTIPFMLMLHGSIDPPLGPLGGPDGYFKTHDNTAAARYEAAFQLIDRSNYNLPPALNLVAGESFWDGYRCGPLLHQQPCSFVLPPDPVGVGEQCFPSGCFTVGSQPSHLDIVFVPAELIAHIGDRFDLFASAGAYVDYTESAAFGTVGADMSSTAHFGFLSLPDGVAVASELGLNYHFDPFAYVNLIADTHPPIGIVPAPATPALAALALLAMAAGRRSTPRHASPSPPLTHSPC